MEEDKNLNPNKRPRVATVDELHRIIDVKNSEINYLKQQVDLLRKDYQELISRIQSNQASDESSNEDDTLEEDMSEADSPEVNSQVNAVTGSSNCIANDGAVTAENRQANAVAGATFNCQANAVAGTPVKRNAAQMTKQILKPKENRGAVKKLPAGPATQQSKSSKSVPIVTTYEINVKDTILKLDKILGHKEYNIKILGNQVTNIGVCTLDDFEKLKVFLKSENVHFFTHTPKAQRPFSVVVRGLSGTFSVDEVLEYLNSLRINCRIVGCHNLGGDRWLFQLGRESDLTGFRNIKYINHCKVVMEKYKKKDVVQCFNCQRFGHVAINCNMPYRCVKCGGSHGPAKCTVPPKEQNEVEIFSTDPTTGEPVRKIGIPTKCANCGVEGHTANFKNCPKRLDILRKIAAKNKIVTLLQILVSQIDPKEFRESHTLLLPEQQQIIVLLVMWSQQHKMLPLLRD